jgi:plasmid stabilization system protein ParE
MAERIQAAVDQLGSRPMLGREGRVRGTRELVVARTKYIVGYRLTAGRCEILPVMHSARAWPKAF